MESKCFMASLSKSLFLTTFILISSATLAVAELFPDISNHHVASPSIQSKQLYIKYTDFPQNLYTLQRFSVKLEARILTPSYDYDYIVTRYEDEQNIQLLDDYVTWDEKEENLFVTQINYKVMDKNFKLPKLILILIKDGVEIEKVKIAPPAIGYHQIAVAQKKFSNVIANKLQINSIKAKQYNNKMLMVVFNIEAVDANLEEFKLKQFEDQGTNDFTQIKNTQSMYYYVIVPNYIDNIKFDYYNPNSSSFVSIELPIILESNLISTQTDLNPFDGNLLFYKQVITLLILIYFKTKSKIILLFLVVFLGIIVKLIMPNKTIIVDANTKVYILPTSSSTIYKILKNNNTVEILLEKDHFVKVLFKNKNIGWIKENDIK